MTALERRMRIKTKLRHTVVGDAKRPRLTVFRSLNQVYAQLIDDATGKTLVAANSLKSSGSLSLKAKAVGTEIAKLAKDAKISTAVFDRAGFAYSGAVKALCEAAREAGLKI
ncbi:MAG: 50S ribosomal protein L18 [Candidatus Berkelbacteria bacterium]|nr:MAG: 50S ribosomal protein L18 [Candidatus Berkelbacteria bacterium]QQG52108.1 MAG: 50S ribosomal protein L18 [Candidatus Berkelbacteria bacterium]